MIKTTNNTDRQVPPQKGFQSIPEEFNSNDVSSLLRKKAQESSQQEPVENLGILKKDTDTYEPETCQIESDKQADYVVLKGVVSSSDEPPLLYSIKREAKFEGKVSLDNTSDDDAEYCLSIARYTAKGKLHRAPLIESESSIADISFDLENRAIIIDDTTIKVDKHFYICILEHSYEVGGRDVEVEISDNGRIIDVEEIDRGEVKRYSTIIIKDPERKYEVVDILNI